MSNNDPAGFLSGTLRLQIWATDSPYSCGTIHGYVLGTRRLEQLEGGSYYYQNVRAKVPSLPLPHGRFFITLTLAEFRNGHYVLVDSVSFPKPKSFK